MPRRSRSRCALFSTATVTIACAALMATVTAMRAPDVSKREITWATRTVDAVAGGDSSASITPTDVGEEVGSSAKGVVISANTARVGIWRQEQSSDLSVKVDAQPKRAKRAPTSAATVTGLLGVQARVHFARAAAAVTTTIKVLKTTATTAKTTPRRPTTSRVLPSTTSRSSSGGGSSSNSSSTSSSSSSSNAGNNSASSSSSSSSSSSDFNSPIAATVAAATTSFVVADATNAPTLNTSKGLATTAQVSPSAVAVSSAFTTASAENVVTPSSSRMLAVTTERSENGPALSNRSDGATALHDDLYLTAASNALPTVVDFNLRVSKVATSPIAHVTSVSGAVYTAAATAQLLDSAASARPPDVSKAESATSAAAFAVGARTSAILQTSSADTNEEFSEKIITIAPSTVMQASSAAVTSKPGALSSLYALRTTENGATAAVTAVTTASRSLDISPVFSASTSDRQLSVSSSAATSRAITVLSVVTAQPSIYQASSLAVSDGTWLTRWQGTSSPPAQATGGTVANETISSHAVGWRGNSTASSTSGTPVARNGPVSDVRPTWQLTLWLCGCTLMFARWRGRGSSR